MPHDFAPMLSAVDLMLEVFDIKGWRNLVQDPSLIEETAGYTGLSASIPPGVDKVTPEMLPPFVIE